MFLLYNGNAETGDHVGREQCPEPGVADVVLRDDEDDSRRAPDAETPEIWWENCLRFDQHRSLRKINTRALKVSEVFWGLGGRTRESPKKRGKK